MFKENFFKKENLIMLGIFIISTLLIVIGFYLLFLRTSGNSGPKIVQTSNSDILWTEVSSNIFEQKIKYPAYLSLLDKKDDMLTGVTISEIKSDKLLTYFDNRNHISFYPEGVDNQLFYGKTKTSDYISESGQEYVRTEYLTVDNKVWGVLFAPKQAPKTWQSKGFIWIQSGIKKREELCISKTGILISNINCDPYSGEEPVYRGEVSDLFINIGYEIINKNRF